MIGLAHYRLGYQLRESYAHYAGRRRRWWHAPVNLLRYLAPLDYVRYREFEFALGVIARHHPHFQRALDLGSPKLLPLLLAEQQPRAQIVCSDIRMLEVAPPLHAAQTQGMPLLGGIADARQAGLRSAQFDLITSLSVFEHIAPEQGGEVPAARELGRLLAPGGIAVLTVPFSRSYFAEYRSGTVYERSGAASEPVFFQRFYDRERLQRDLIEPSGLELAEFAVIEERFYSQDPHRRLAGWLSATPLRHLLLGPFFPLLAKIFLSPAQALERCRKPYIACLVLRAN